MKKQIFFIHGGDAFTKHADFLQHLKTVPLRNLPDAEVASHWTKTLVEDMGVDYEVFMPSMPNKQNAHYEEWSIWFERHLPLLRDGVILIGWSLGGMFLAKYLSEHNMPVSVAALFLLAAPCGTYEDETGNDCGSFQFDPNILKNMDKMVQNCEIWHSKDDFVVPFTHAERYKEFLPAPKISTFSDKNHFLVTSLPELIDALKRY